MDIRYKKYIVRIILLIAIVFGVSGAIGHSWICDDAFISFRYAKNLIDGNGLVFNIGERVEGYTNFLWTILITLGMKSGVDPCAFTKVTGIICFVITIFLMGLLSYRLFRNKSALFIPLTSLCLLVHRDFLVYATSGLETMWVTMLIAFGYIALIMTRNKKGLLGGSIIFILAALSRPDALIFYFMGIVFILITRSDKRRNLFIYLLPLLLIYLPYWIIRLNYYGYPFPNTYYAKSANLWYFSQGIKYVWLYFKTYYILLIIFPAILWLIRKKSISNMRKDGDVYKALLLCMLFLIPYLFYVLKTGGDFMFARFIIPVTPLLIMILEISLHEIVKRDNAKYLVAIIIFISILFRFDQFPNGKVIYGITDERYYYPPEKINAARHEGLKLKKYFSGLNVKVAFYGAHAMYIYYSEVPQAIESNAGLTDEYIAHLPLKKRGRVGHEKTAPMEYLFEKKVNFLFMTTFPSTGKHDNLRRVSFGDYKSYIFTYDNSIMKHLKKFDEISFIDFPEYLDKYITKMDGYSPERVRKDYAFFRIYYFTHNFDKDRQMPFFAKMQE